MSKQYNELHAIVVTYTNGNKKDALRAIQNLNRSDRARVVSMFRANVSTKMAFEIAEKIILADFGDK